MGKKRVIFLLMVAFATIASAQEVTMKDVFSSMPDSIFPYLTHNNRLDMVDFSESGMKAEVNNELDGKSRLDTLTNDYLHLTLNESVDVEMKLLKSDRLLDDTTKTIICMATTYANTESRMDFYTSKWHSISVPMKYDYNQLIVRPDTMSTETFTELSRLASGYCVLAKLFPTTTDIELSPTFPMLSNEDKQKLEFLKKKITLNFHTDEIKFVNN